MAKEAQFLYRIQAKRVGMLTEGPTAQERTVVGEHFSYLQELTNKGVVILAGRTMNNDATCFGIVILRADSEEAARRIMLDDPAVKHDVMRAELFPYQIALMGKA